MSKAQDAVRKKVKKYLDKTASEEAVNIFKQEPRKVDLAYKAAIESGFVCHMSSDGILSFDGVNYEDANNWLINNFAEEEQDKVKRVPFSWGVNVRGMNYDQSAKKEMA